ncbi:fatty acid desaturase [Paraherbaspirillum soli]|uniref:Fatty acid desaturase n=1 Tax=Paraherbaspirillum soli TaxID=631222 RepID=A0ABW0MD33_9BURK
MPPVNSFPSSPGPEFATFLEKSKRLEGARLAEVIPKSLLEPKAGRGLAGFVISYALYIGAIVGVAYAPHWSLYLPLWIVAGLGGWGLHCIAHDCGHNSFSRNKTLNVTIGHLALLPLLYPFYAWKHVHNLHHFNTNNLELDTDWRPIPKAMYTRMSLWERAVYRGTRTWLCWAGTINYWLASGVRPGFFPKKDMRRDARRSLAFVTIVTIVYFSALVYFTGVRGFLLFFFAPWIATHTWFSITTLMHHTASDIPFLTSEHWTANASRMLVTTDYRYPKWLLFLTHNISIHTAHHVIPVVPFYNLQKAQLALKEAYPGMIREKPFTFGDFWKVVKTCHFYDPDSGYYKDLAERRAGDHSSTAPVTNV